MITHYRCSNCGAEDKDRGTSPPVPMVLNCYQCKAGYHKDISEMLATRLGMFPVALEDPQTGEVTPL